MSSGALTIQNEMLYDIPQSVLVNSRVVPQIRS
jgi:hypothetical protein